MLDVLDRRYRAALQAVLDQVQARIFELYGRTVDLADLDTSFERFIPEAAELIRAAQSAGVSLASGYLSALVSLAAGRIVDLSGSENIVGLNQEGKPLAEGMAAFSAMVKEQIGLGNEDPTGFGRFIAERFADAEVTGAVDRHTEAVTSDSGQFTGWVGIVSPKACSPCQANARFHRLDEPIYRHGSCRCTKQYVVAQ